METNSTSVLVVGGSLVGLSAAVFLGWRGVPTVVVETHTGSHPHPRAIGYTPRTMELFRTVGLGALIPQAPRGFRLRRCKIESLAGKWFAESDWTPSKPGEPQKQPAPPVEEIAVVPTAFHRQEKAAPIDHEELRPLFFRAPSFKVAFQGTLQPRAGPKRQAMIDHRRSDNDTANTRWIGFPNHLGCMQMKETAASPRRHDEMTELARDDKMFVVFGRTNSFLNYDLAGLPGDQHHFAGDRNAMEVDQSKIAAGQSDSPGNACATNVLCRLDTFLPGICHRLLSRTTEYADLAFQRAACDEGQIYFALKLRPGQLDHVGNVRAAQQHARRVACPPIAKRLRPRPSSRICDAARPPAGFENHAALDLGIAEVKGRSFRQRLSSDGALREFNIARQAQPAHGDAAIGRDTVADQITADTGVVQNDRQGIGPGARDVEATFRQQDSIPDGRLSEI